ncbi:MAG: insulinase family protein [Termitinemataceae bacterium]|nr:MAG: insulinase family protein [Termitinemataceae bacterium]
MIKKNLFVFIPILIISIFFSACDKDSAAKYGSLGAPDDEIPLNPELRYGTLPSGLKYFIFENKKPENRALITLAVNAGSVLEEENERGIAHFVEHMAFNSTERFPGTEVVEYLRSLGMRFGADVNAYTSFDRTVYGIEVPVEVDELGNKKLPEKALAIIDDWTRAINFFEKDVNNERPIILEEYRMRLGAGDRASRELLALLFAGSKYAERRPIGLPEVIEGAPADELKEFYKKWYKAANMAIIFSGDFDGAKTEASLAEHFKIEPDKDTGANPVFELPAPQKGSIVTKRWTDNEITQTFISFYYKMKWKPEGNKLRDFRESLLDNLIDTIISERWTDAEHKSETPFFSAYSGKWRTVNTSLHFALGGAAKSGKFKEAFSALLMEKERLLRYGVHKSELERAKKTLISDMETALAEKEKRHSANFIDSLTEFFLRGSPFPGIEWELNAARELLPNIDTKDLNAIIKTYFEGDDLLVFVTANSAEESEIPSEEELKELVVLAKKAKVQPLPEASLSSSLLKTPPRAGSITKEETDEASGVVIWTLSNGAKLLLKQTNNQNDQIVLSAIASGGNVSAPLDALISAKLSAELAAASGIGEYKLSKLNKMLAGKQVSLSFSNSYFSRGIEGTSTRGDLPVFFELLYMGFTSPRHDEEMAQILKDEYKTTLTQRRENPETYFNEELQRLIYNSPYMSPLEPEDLDKLDTKKAALWTAYCRNPADYVFCFTGNIDFDDMRPLVETYLASIPEGEPFDTKTDFKIEFPHTVDKTLFKGKEDKSWVFLGHFLGHEWNLEEAMTAEVLSEYLEITLIQEIREKLGGVYGIWPDFSLARTPLPGKLSGEIYFNCSPARVEELTNAVEAELAKIAAGRINQETLKKAKDALIKEWESALEQNNYVARRLVSYAVIFEIPLETLFLRNKLYEAVTAEKLKNITALLLKQGLVRAVLYPSSS